MQTTKGADSLFEQLRKWRRHLHQYPELSFAEKETAKYIVSQLETIDNMIIQKNVGGKHGVVGILQNGDGPTIAVRADIDALPIEEKNTHDYVSKYAGVMHACGHDAHTAMLLGAAHLLANNLKHVSYKER